LWSFGVTALTGRLTIEDAVRVDVLKIQVGRRAGQRLGQRPRVLLEWQIVGEKPVREWFYVDDVLKATVNIDLV
jgi:hypothetical protein